jgi:predicted O-methyltransferase YrrM
MNGELWTQVDDYINEVAIGRDATLEAAAAAAVEAHLPPISVTPAYGKLLHLLARMQRATRILEIGTLAGYSTIWLARAVGADGRVVTIESNPAHAAIARANIERAGFGESVEIRVGNALDVLPQLASAKQPPFDFTFIDADRTGLVDYFDWSVKLSRSGSVIIVDNVVRKGAVVDPANDSVDVRGIRRFNEQLKHDTRVDATMMQTVSAKGYDGFALALVR